MHLCIPYDVNTNSSINEFIVTELMQKRYYPHCARNVSAHCAPRVVSGDSPPGACLLKIEVLYMYRHRAYAKSKTAAPCTSCQRALPAACGESGAKKTCKMGLFRALVHKLT